MREGKARKKFLSKCLALRQTNTEDREHHGSLIPLWGQEAGWGIWVTFLQVLDVWEEGASISFFKRSRKLGKVLFDFWGRGNSFIYPWHQLCPHPTAHVLTTKEKLRESWSDCVFFQIRLPSSPIPTHTSLIHFLFPISTSKLQDLVISCLEN